MRQENKVPTLEQCKKLVELGVWLEPEKYWAVQYRALGIDARRWVLRSISPYGRCCRHESTGDEWLPAPDIAELGELLPDILDRYYLNYGPILGEGEHRVTYHHMRKDHSALLVVPGDTEAQARCAALIWLIENKHINPKDLKI